MGDIWSSDIIFYIWISTFSGREVKFRTGGFCCCYYASRSLTSAKSPVSQESCIIDRVYRSPKPNIPAKDLYHDPVKQALIKEGWTITAAPYTVEYEEFKVFAYLAAECSLAVERGSQKIAVEITTFLRPSSVLELENALGQYILYRNLLSVTDPKLKLYLAVSDRIYNNFSLKNASQLSIYYQSKSNFNCSCGNSIGSKSPMILKS